MLIAKRELNVASRGPFRVSFSLPSSLSLSHTRTHTRAHALAHFLSHSRTKFSTLYLSTQFSPLSCPPVPFVQAVSSVTTPRGSSLPVTRGLVSSSSFILATAREVFFVRGSTTTEKRTALFVWRSIATRQSRDRNVRTRENLFSLTSLATIPRSVPFAFRYARAFFFPDHRFPKVEFRMRRYTVQIEPHCPTNSPNETLLGWPCR